MFGSHLSKFVACLAFAIFSSSAPATPLTWTVSAVFQPAGILLNIGTFTYDADTQQVLAWGVNGLSGPACPGGPPCFGIRSGGVSENGILVAFSQSSSDFVNALRLQLTTAMTDAGGTIPLVPGSCVICSGPGFNGGSTTSGSGSLSYVATVGNGAFQSILAGQIAASPEPASASYLGAAILAGMISLNTLRKARRPRKRVNSL